MAATNCNTTKSRLRLTEKRKLKLKVEVILGTEVPTCKAPRGEGAHGCNLTCYHVISYMVCEKKNEVQMGTNSKFNYGGDLKVQSQDVIGRP